MEYIVLGVFFIIIFTLIRRIVFYSLIFLVIGACEGALGLSILVTLRRTHGGDTFNLFNLNYDKVYFFTYRDFIY